LINLDKWFLIESFSTVDFFFAIPIHLPSFSLVQKGTLDDDGYGGKSVKAEVDFSPPSINSGLQ
jgi:hypothetical protein